MAQDRRSRFRGRFTALLAQKREQAADVNAAVAAIIARVREEGDAGADRAHAGAIDALDLRQAGIKVSPGRDRGGADQGRRATLEALELAHDRILAHHQRPAARRTTSITTRSGVELGTRWTPVASAGLYVPGGTASYPSSVLMNAVPAKVAGVQRIVMVVPAPKGALNPLVLVAAELAGIDEIYRVGGAQAIAALAYGTESIAPVVKIVGPGNAYVAAAKRQVFGQVGIDMVAGPSEVRGDRRCRQRSGLDRRRPARPGRARRGRASDPHHRRCGFRPRGRSRRRGRSLRRCRAPRRRARAGAISAPSSSSDASTRRPRWPTGLAPEHLRDRHGRADALAARIRNAGAIFIGRYTPEVIGDYVAGSNHVLPTARSARLPPAFRVLDFMKRTSILKLDADSLAALAPAAMALAEAEGLDAHRRSVADQAQSQGRRMSEDRQQVQTADPRLIEVTLDEASIGRNNAEVEHEREVAIFDLLEKNSFALEGHDRALHAASVARRQSARVQRGRQWARADPARDACRSRPSAGMVKDYFLVCESYYAAIKTQPAVQDRGDRHGPARHARRGQPAPAGAAQGQDRGRYRHRAPPVHAALRAALEGLTRGNLRGAPDVVPATAHKFTEVEMRLFFSLLAGLLVAGLTIPADARPQPVKGVVQGTANVGKGVVQGAGQAGVGVIRGTGTVAKGTVKGLRCVVTLGNRC